MIAAADRPMAFDSGDIVRVVEGPFAGYVGKVVRVDQLRRRYRVAVEFFGRESRLDLDSIQVEPAS